MKANVNNFLLTKISDYYRFTRNIIRSFYFDEWTCNDLIQDVMLKLYSAKGTFACEAQFKSWVYLVTKNHCINYKKKRCNNSTAIIDNIENYYTNQEPELLSSEEKKTILQIVLKLPRSLSYPIFFFYYKNLKYYEIAEKMQIPIGTVKSRINKARKILKEKLFFLK